MHRARITLAQITCSLSGHARGAREYRGGTWADDGLYTIFVHFEAFVHKSIILLLPRPPTLPTLLQY